ncbi:uncharacterized protein LOC116845430 isoform X2 [Odontomachus brunneus]|nr:uncharacterized protein LOC116845430 isoform X2 [Odontomachus brunneus]
MDNHKGKRNKKKNRKKKRNKKKQQTTQNTSKLKELSVILHASYPALIQYDEMLQLKPEKKYNLQLIIDDESSTKSDCRSNKISHIPKNTVLMNTKVSQHTLKSTVSRRSRLNTSTSILSPDKSDLTHGTSIKSAIVGSDDTNCLDKKNLSFIDHNSKTIEVFNDGPSIASTKYDRNLESRKRTAEENSINVNTRTKRIKLNRNCQQSNVESHNTLVKQQFEDFLSINTTTKNAKCVKTDLRVTLNKKRTEKVYKLKRTDSDETINDTMSMKINNKNSAISVKRVKTDLRITLNKKRTEKVCKLKRSSDETINDTMSMKINNKNSAISVKDIVENKETRKDNVKKLQNVQDSTGNRIEKKKIKIESLPEMCNKNELLTAKQTLSKINQNVPVPKETVHNKLLEQTLHTDSLSASSTNLTSNCKIKNYFNRFCFAILMHSTCKSRYLCTYKHNFQEFINTFYSEDSNKIIDAINFAIHKEFYFFCHELYKKSLEKLTIDDILTIYRKFYDIYKLSKDITYDVIKELLSREISLKNIVDHIVAAINSSVIIDVTKYYEIFHCVKQFMKPGEYWYIARSMVLILTPHKHIVENILQDCIWHKKLSDVRDINNMLINKLHPGIMSELDKNLMMYFKSLLSEKTQDTYNVESVQDSEESFMEMDPIASPDSKQTNSPRSYNNVVIDRSLAIIKKRHVNVRSTRPYILHPIDNLPEAQSVYRNQDHLWDFYTDLEKLKKALEHEAYDCVIDILVKYVAMQDDILFVRACCNRFSKEIKNKNHLINIIERTGEKYSSMRKILDII